MNGDGTSSSETDASTADKVEVDAVQVVCKDYLYLITGEAWSCVLANETYTCPLTLELSTSGSCELWCGTTWYTNPKDVSFPNEDQMVYIPHGSGTVHTCTKIK